MLGIGPSVSQKGRILEMRGKDFLRLCRMWCLFQIECVLFYKEKEQWLSAHIVVFLPCNFLGVQVRTGHPSNPGTPLPPHPFIPPPPCRSPASPAVVIHPFTTEGSSQVGAGPVPLLHSPVCVTRTSPAILWFHLRVLDDSLNYLGRWIQKAKYCTLWK